MGIHASRNEAESISGIYEEHPGVGFSRFERDEDPASKAFLPWFVQRGAIARGILHGF